MNGMWLLPTRRRWDTLARFFRAANEMGMSLPGVVLVNEREFEQCIGEYDAVSLPANWRYHLSSHESLCETMRGAIDLYRDLDFVGTVTDDVVPETPRWEECLLADYRSHGGRSIISCNDGGQAPRRMAGAIVWPIALFRAVGYWVPSGFMHCFVDDLWETLGREAQCWHVDMDVMVRHLHPWVTGQADDTHAHSYRKDKWDNDQALYTQWLRYYKAPALAKLRAYLKEREAA